MLVLSAETTTLTEREQKGLRLLAHGETNRKIAEKLSIAEITVRFHLRNIYSKIDVGTRSQAVPWAMPYGLGNNLSLAIGKKLSFWAWTLL